MSGEPDASFAWRVQRRYPHRDAEIVELHLESQTWQGQLWKHQLLLVRPHRVRDERHAVFVVGGGRWRDEYETATDDAALPEDGELFVAIARLLCTPVVVLGQVPYQPLFDLTEDRLIAHTFERYLATGDAEWPLLLPMVNSVVRAFDASSAASEREWGSPLERFTVTGGSKRGWTTWLTAAVDRARRRARTARDRRAEHGAALPAPDRSVGRAFGGDPALHGSRARSDSRFARGRGPSADRRSFQLSREARPAEARRCSPPTTNIFRSTRPTSTSASYASRSICSICRTSRIASRSTSRSSAAYARCTRRRWAVTLCRGSNGIIWPPAESSRSACGRSLPARRWRVWRAVSDDRDFRDAEWQPVAESPRSEARFVLREPAEGYAATVGEAAFGAGRRAFTLSTSLSVAAAANERPYGTQPVGETGLCAALERRLSCRCPSRGQRRTMRTFRHAAAVGRGTAHRYGENSQATPSIVLVRKGRPSTSASVTRRDLRADRFEMRARAR